MKKTLFVLAAITALSFSLCSCSDIEPSTTLKAEKEMPLSFRGLNAAATKGAVDGTLFPWHRQMVVSSYKNVPSTAVSGNTDSSQDFFENITFSKSGTTGNTWEEDKYWPLSGTLDFLAFSFEGYESTAHPSAYTDSTYKVGGGSTGFSEKTYKYIDGISPYKVEWGSDNVVAKKLVLGVPDNSEKQDDILYGALADQTYNSNGQPIVFHHAEALLTFIARSNVAYDGPANSGITIDSISVDGAYHSGMLTVDNPKCASCTTGTLEASWRFLSADSSGYNAAIKYVHSDPESFVQSVVNYPVPSSYIDLEANHFGINYCCSGTLTDNADSESGRKRVVYGTPWKARNAGMILPEQKQVPVIIEYTIHNGYSADGKTALDNKMQYTFTPATDAVWEMGKKYVYAIDVTMNEITVSPTVTDWSQWQTSVPFGQGVEDGDGTFTNE